MTHPRTILIADDEAPIRKSLRDVFLDEGFTVLEAKDGKDAVSLAQASELDIIILDIKMPKMDGLTALTEIKTISPDAPVIVFTAHGTSERAIEAMKLGAYDYIEKPFDLDDFLLVVKRAIEYADLRKELLLLRTQQPEEDFKKDNSEIIGSSGKMRELFKLIGKITLSDTTVLIEGESGTGKEIVANAIQRHSNRSAKPFIKINCAALPETLLESELFGHERGAFTGANYDRPGRFELAEGGTLFLDEVSEMSSLLQSKLLRVLQEKTFERVGGKETHRTDVRVMAATNKNLNDEMKKGLFREDLFYRLNVAHISIPPLREHPEDIPQLVEHFIARYGKDRNVSISSKCLNTLRTYSWPGNIRELENIIQQAVVFAKGNVITVDQLPLALRAEGEFIWTDDIWRSGIPLNEIMDDVEKNLIMKALRTTQGNKTKAAELLQINRRVLYDKMKHHHLTDTSES